MTVATGSAGPPSSSDAPAGDEEALLEAVAVDGAGTAQVVTFARREAPEPVLVDGVPDTPADDLPGGTADDLPGDAAGSAVDDAVDDAADDRGTADAVPPPEQVASPPARRRPRTGPTKRELRYQQTREAIVDAAADLFAERGFDAVRVTEIAERAGVVEKTVFNHFPVKEGLVFEADPPMRTALLEAVRLRRPGDPATAAAGAFVVAAVSQLGSPAAAGGVAAMARVIRGSRTLQAREREILGMLTDALAEQIAAETRAAPGDLEPWLAANAVLGLYASLLELARDRVLAGGSGPELVDELRRRGRRGLALLQHGLAGYARRVQEG